MQWASVFRGARDVDESRGARESGKRAGDRGRKTRGEASQGAPYLLPRATARLRRLNSLSHLHAPTSTTHTTRDTAIKNTAGYHKGGDGEERGEKQTHHCSVMLQSMQRKDRRKTTPALCSECCTSTPTLSLCLLLTQPHTHARAFLLFSCCTPRVCFSASLSTSSSFGLYVFCFVSCFLSLSLSLLSPFSQLPSSLCVAVASHQA